MNNGAKFSNNNNLLSISNNNIIFTISHNNATINSLLTTDNININNNLNVYNDSFFKNNITIGTNSSNFITLNSKLSDFIMHNNTQFINTNSKTIEIIQDNIILKSNNTTTNNLSILYNSHFKGNIIGNNSDNFITFNSKLSDFTLHKGSHFSDTSDLLTITKTNTLLNTNLTTNFLNVNHNTIIKGISTLKGDTILGTSLSNLTTFNSKLSDFYYA